ncbi:hypothetical protein K435DRAFT_861912 [Dendrothele bispora CBS 962.96]|uniref:Uncharacterized protein n=1 Tax=Dendrothele bispora (strain CBS 962.96) TaxID=1314807 RepID=A0A4V6T5C1_DENBC|nr:hypothetical protein K435DRAFT_861912 [Dendrothele bispora CBS 962.96]
MSINCCQPTISTRSTTSSSASNTAPWYLVTGCDQKNNDGVYLDLKTAKRISSAGHGSYSAKYEANVLIQDWQEFCFIAHIHNPPLALDRQQFLDALQSAINPERRMGALMHKQSGPILISDSEESDDYLSGKLKQSVSIPGPRSPPPISSPSMDVMFSRSSSLTKKPSTSTKVSPARFTIDLKQFPECMPVVSGVTPKSPKPKPRTPSPSKAPLPSIDNVASVTSQSTVPNDSKFYVLDSKGCQKIVTDKERALAIFEEMSGVGMMPEMMICDTLESAMTQF